MMNKLLTVMFSLLCLVFSQVALAMPAHQSVKNVAQAMSISVEQSVDMPIETHSHHHDIETNASDLKNESLSNSPHDMQHDCCPENAEQQHCDNCTSTCSQLRIAFAPADTVFQVPTPESSTQNIFTPAGSTHAGYFAALFKPPIFS